MEAGKQYTVTTSTDISSKTLLKRDYDRFGANSKKKTWSVKDIQVL